MSVVRLAELPTNQTNLTCDVCIVGAGAAGIYLATRLAEHRLRTIIVEAGPETCIGTEEVGFMPKFKRERYSGAVEGRAFGFGGTTSRWGGQLFPYTFLDERVSGDPYQESWACLNRIASQHLQPVLQILGLPLSLFSTRGAESYPEPIISALSAVGLSLSDSVWLPFRRRNFQRLIGARQLDFVTVLLEAIACKWAAVSNVDNGAFIDRLQAAGSGGRQIEIQARQFVVAAGAIESARILLELDSCYGNEVLLKSAAVGCYLSDHLSFPLAAVQKVDNRRATWLFVPRFHDGLMRTARILGSGDSYRKLPRFFAHIVFDRDDEAFSLARSLLQAAQMRTLPKTSLKKLARALPGFACLAWQRVVNKRVFIPASAGAHLQLDFEQLPMRNNRISLGSELDRYGRRMALVDWGVSNEDYQNAVKISEVLLQSWAEACEVLRLPKLVPSDSRFRFDKLFDSYHPVGTCMLGGHAEAVVTTELAVRGTTNLSVLSTGIFPSAGTANPTLSMLCCGEQLAVRLTRALA